LISYKIGAGDTTMDKTTLDLRQQLISRWSNIITKAGTHYALLHEQVRGLHPGQLTLCGFFTCPEAAIAHFQANEQPDPLCYTLKHVHHNEVPWVEIEARWTTEGLDSKPFDIWHITSANGKMTLQALLQP